MCTADLSVDTHFASLQGESFSEVITTPFAHRHDLASDACLHEAPRSRRKKLWEIAACYHCVVIGTCLPMNELRHFARRAGVEQSDSDSEYGLHTTVHLAGKRNALSQLMHKAMEARFTVAVRRFGQAATDEEVRKLWKDGLASGEVAGALWAVVSHPLATDDVRDTASQDMHMLSHQLGAASRADLRRLHVREREVASLRQALERQRDKSAEKHAERARALTALEQRAAAASDLELRLGVAEERLREFENAAAYSEVKRLLDATSLRAQRAEELGQALLQRPRKTLRAAEERGHYVFPARPARTTGCRRT